MQSHYVLKHVLKREEIDSEQLEELKGSIVATCESRIKLSNSAEQAKSFYDSFFGKGNAELVSTLQTLINDIQGIPTAETETSPFKTYANILSKLYAVYIRLKEKQVEDSDAIDAIKTLLSRHLKPLAAADWAQEKREEHYRVDDEDAIIKYAINTLETASFYDSDYWQAFCEKWDIADDETDYYLWKELVDTYQLEFDEESGLRYIVGLQHKLGLSYYDITTSHARHADAHGQPATTEKGAILSIVDQAYGTFLTYKFRAAKDSKNGSDIKETLDKIDKLFVAIQRNPADRSSMASLLRTIYCNELPSLSSGEIIFSQKLKDKIDELSKQLEIFTVSRLYQLCEDYMRNYIDTVDPEKVDAAVLPSKKCALLIEKFFEPMINNVLEPAIHILTGNPVFFSASDEFDKLCDFTDKYFHEKCLERTIRKIVTDKSIADTVFSFLKADTISDQLDKLGVGLWSLKKALKAACDYYHDTKTSLDERKAAIFFMGELLKLDQPDFDSVIQEASNFIDGLVEKYRCEIDRVQEASNFIDGLVEKYRCEIDRARESRFNSIINSGLFAGAAICFDKNEVGYNALTNLFTPKSPQPGKAVSFSTPALNTSNSSIR